MESLRRPAPPFITASVLPSRRSTAVNVGTASNRRWTSGGHQSISTCRARSGGGDALNEQVVLRVNFFDRTRAMPGAAAPDLHVAVARWAEEGAARERRVPVVHPFGRGNNPQIVCGDRPRHVPCVMRASRRWTVWAERSAMQLTNGPVTFGVPGMARPNRGKGGRRSAIAKRARCHRRPGKFVRTWSCAACERSRDASHARRLTVPRTGPSRWPHPSTSHPVCASKVRAV